VQAPAEGSFSALDIGIMRPRVSGEDPAIARRILLDGLAPELPAAITTIPACH
jgi:hypothetical protein